MHPRNIESKSFNFDLKHNCLREIVNKLIFWRALNDAQLRSTEVSEDWVGTTAMKAWPLKPSMLVFYFFKSY